MLLGFGVDGILPLQPFQYPVNENYLEIYLSYKNLWNALNTN